MVPVEQLGDRNFLQIYYIASEIKREVEITPDTKKFIEISDFIYYNAANATPNYPYFFQNREQAIIYLVSIGMVIDYWHFESSRKIRITPPPQEVFFSFCSKLARIYNQRFIQPAMPAQQVGSLTPEQIIQTAQILQAISFRIGNDPAPTIIYVPYEDFPSGLERFALHGLLYKLANDFSIFKLGKHIEKEVDLRFPKSASSFYAFKKLVDEKYSAVTAAQKEEQLSEKPAQKEEKIHKVEVINSHLNVKVQTNTIASKVGRFPEKLKAGTQWRDITFVFIDERNVVIHVNGKKVPQSCEDMKMVKGKNEVPTETWKFFECLARHNSEIVPTDPDAKPTFKKQKELLSSALKAYFQKEEDPFFPYESSPEKRHRSYKTRFGVFYEEKGKKVDKFADLGSVMSEQMQRQ